MPGAKNRKLDDMAEESESNDSSGDCLMQADENVQVEFEGRAPGVPDTAGITQLLSRLFLKAHINCSEIANLIVEQNYIGSVIGQCQPDEAESGDDDDDDDMCDDDTIFGITTILNITKRNQSVSIKQLITHILERAKSNATDTTFKFFEDVLTNDSQHVGFLINERFINLPPLISVPMFEDLQKEMEEAKQKGKDFNFTYLLMMMKVYKIKDNDDEKPKSEDLYTNAEEEAITKFGIHSFEYSVEGESDTGMSGKWTEDDEALAPYRKIVIIDGDNFSKLVTDVSNFVGGV